MRHTSLLLALLSGLPALELTSADVRAATPPSAAGQDEPSPGPSKAEVEAAVKTLKAGLAAKAAEERIAALLASAEVVHPDVVKVIAGATADPAKAVRDFALDLLGKIDEPSALAALHAYAKRNRRTLPEDPELYILVLKSAARHGDPSTIEYLTDKIFDVEQHELVRARILSLANIRDKRAVEALFDLMTKADRRKVTPFLAEYQLAFNVLLGVDVGKNQDRWLAWWNEHRKSYELAAEFPKLPEESLRAWQLFWGLERTYSRNKKRSERGQDPEGGK